MKHALLYVAILGLIAGCSTPKESLRVIDKSSALELKPNISKAEASFVEENGTLVLEFDEDGNWIKIKTSGTSPIEFNHSNAREQAFTVAQLRAKRTLIEFMTNEIKSQKTVTNFSDVVLRDILKDKNTTSSNPKSSGSSEDLDNVQSNTETNQESIENRNRANKVALSVREQINDNSTGILKGVYVSKRTLDRESNQVSVEVSVSRKTINTAFQVRSLMGN